MDLLWHSWEVGYMKESCVLAAVSIMKVAREKNIKFCQCDLSMLKLLAPVGRMLSLSISLLHQPSRLLLWLVTLILLYNFLKLILVLYMMKTIDLPSSGSEMDV